MVQTISNRIWLFLLLSMPVIIISWKSLRNIHSHGFYRLFSWEGILWLFTGAYTAWFRDAFSVNQLISWLFLIISAYMVIAGVVILKQKGKPSDSRQEQALYGFERTTRLVDNGIFAYIRHPLYSSLLFLTWGILFKNPTMDAVIVAVLSSVFLYFTARTDEKECLTFFGNEYAEYMKRTKMFVPFIV